TSARPPDALRARPAAARRPRFPAIAGPPLRRRSRARKSPRVRPAIPATRLRDRRSASAPTATADRAATGRGREARDRWTPDPTARRDRARRARAALAEEDR